MWNIWKWLTCCKTETIGHAKAYEVKYIEPQRISIRYATRLPYQLTIAKKNPMRIAYVNRHIYKVTLMGQIRHIDIDRTIGDQEPLIFDIDLSMLSQTFADITDIIFTIKKKAGEEDDKYFSARMSDSEIAISDQGGGIVRATVKWEDYTNLNCESQYLGGLFVKFDQFNQNVEQLFKINLLPSFLHQDTLNS